MHGTIGDEESIIAGAHFGGWLPPPLRVSPTFRIGFMLPMSLLNPIPLSFPLGSSLEASAPGTLETPVGLKAERTPGWKPMVAEHGGGGAQAEQLPLVPGCGDAHVEGPVLLLGAAFLGQSRFD